MAEELGKIVFKADTSDLDRGATALDKLGEAGDRAATSADALNASFADTAASSKNLNSAFAAGAAIRDEVSQSYQGTTKELQGLQKELVSIRAKVDPVGTAFDNLAQMSDKLQEGLKRGLIDPSDYASSIRGVDSLTEALEKSVYETTAAGRAAKELEQTEKAAAAAKENFIAKLREQSEMQGKTTAEILEYKAAQLGATAESQPFIAALKAQETNFKKGAISAGQYRQAMRQLPAQFTDIITSIASGMPIYMVAIQQGGQIKDSFGGIGNAAKAMIGMLNPVSIGIAAVVGTLGTLAYGLIQGEKEASEFNKQLILTGNYAGVTADRLADMATDISKELGTTAGAAKALAATVSTGAFKGDQLKSIATAAVAMQEATGQAIDKTIGNFQRLMTEPTKGSVELNKQLHYLTASTFQQISALEQSGNVTDAARIASDAYADALAKRGTEVQANLGYIESAWHTIKDAAASAWDAMLDVGRQETISPEKALGAAQQKLKGLQETLKTLQQPTGPKGVANYLTGGGGFQSEQSLQQKQDAQARIESVKAEIVALQKGIDLRNDLNTTTQKSNEINDAAIKGQESFNKFTKAGTTSLEKRNLAFKELDKSVAALREASKTDPAIKVPTEAEIAKARAGIEKLYKDPKIAKPKAVTVTGGEKALDLADQQTLALKAQLKLLESHSYADEKISQQRKDLLNTEAQIEVLTAAASKRKLTTNEQSLLASQKALIPKKEELAVIGDQILAQQKLNDLVDYGASIDRATAQIVGKRGLSDLQSQRADEAQQLLNTFIKAGGDLNDTESQYTQQYLINLDKIDNKYNEIKESQMDWSGGIKASLGNWLDDAENVADSTGQAMSSVLNGAVSNIADALNNSKSDWRSYTVSILKMIEEIILKLTIAATVKAGLEAAKGSSLGWLSSFGGALAGGASGGGSAAAGSTGAMGMPTDWASYAKFNTGGYTGAGDKYEPAGIVHKDEFVFNKEATNRIGVDNLYSLMRGYADGGLVGGPRKSPVAGLGGGSSNFNIQTSVSIDNSGGQQQQTAAQGELIDSVMRQKVIGIVSEQLDKAMRQSGRIASFVQAKVGR